MPRTIQDSNGAEIEVFSKEELDTQRNDAVEAFKKENPDKSEEIKKMQDDLKAKDDEMRKLLDKDTNFKNLREAKDKVEQEKEELRKKLDDAVSAVKQEVVGSVLNDHIKESLDKLADGDEGMRKKIEFHAERLGIKSAKDKNEVNTAIQDAYRLATDFKHDTLHSGVVSSAGAGIPAKTNKKVSPEDAATIKQIAGRGGLKLSDEDIKKHAK